MKQPILLKTILDICFILLALTFFSAVIIFIITLIHGESFYPITVNGSMLTEITPSTVFLISAELIIGGMILYTVYILRKLIRNFLKGKLYTRFQIATLNLVGQLVIFITLAKGFIDFLGKILFESRVGVDLGMELSFGSFWFILAIGLFFIYLSKIFENAKNLKEENELTV
jgi:hypothetical protein